MYKPNIPPFCQPCIDRQQAHCLHAHISFRGGFHFTAGEVWDDLIEVCDDCGVNLEELDSNPQPISDNQELTFLGVKLCQTD